MLALPCEGAGLPRVVIIGPGNPESKGYGETFRAALQDLGHVQDRSVIVESHILGEDPKGMGALVDDIIARKPDVFVVWENVAQAIRARNTTIPIVLAGAIDPVKAGLARSMGHPGMNVTGIAQLNDQLPARHIGLMKDILPALKSVGAFVDDGASGCAIVAASARKAANNVGAAFITYNAGAKDGVVRAFEQMATRRPDMLLPCPTPHLYMNRELLFERALRLRIPLSSFIVANVPDGVLFAYATSIHEINRRAAVYVDRILKGADAGSLPIEQPTKFELVINLRTAKALGLTIPQSVLLRADRVIE